MQQLIGVKGFVSYGVIGDGTEKTPFLYRYLVDCSEERRLRWDEA